MHSSAALRTTDMWSNVIGDEFGKANDAAQVRLPPPPLRPRCHAVAPNVAPNVAHPAVRQNVLAGTGGGGNTYEMAQNLMTLARLSGRFLAVRARVSRAR